MIGNKANSLSRSDNHTQGKFISLCHKTVPPTEIKPFPLVCQVGAFLSWISSDLCPFQHSGWILGVLRCTRSLAVTPHYKSELGSPGVHSEGRCLQSIFVFYFLTCSDSNVALFFLLFNLISNSGNNQAEGACCTRECKAWLEFARGKPHLVLVL